MLVEIVRDPPRPTKARYVEFKSPGEFPIQHVQIDANEIRFLSGLVEVKPGNCGSGGKFFVDRRMLRELCEKITQFLDEKENN